MVLFKSMVSKIRLTNEDAQSLTKRLRKWPYWVLIPALLFTSGMTGLDVVILDFVPFIDEALLIAATGFLLNVLRLKFLYGDGDDDAAR